MHLEQVRVSSPSADSLGSQEKRVKSWKRAGAAGAGPKEEEKSLKQLQATGALLVTGKP